MKYPLYPVLGQMTRIAKTVVKLPDWNTAAYNQTM